MNQPSRHEEFERIERRFAGTLHIAVRDMASGECVVRNEHEVLPTASAAKLFVLCELFRQHLEEGVDLDRELVVEAEAFRPGDGVLRAFRPGFSLSLINLATLMMMVSDNTATGLLVKTVGPERVTTFMHALGLERTSMHQGFDVAPEASQPESSAFDCMTLMSKLLRHELLTPVLCDEVIRIMRANRMNDMLGRVLPVGEDWGDAPEWIASKIGYGRCRAEVGAVHLAGRTWAIGIFFCPRTPLPLFTKSLADYPPVLAVAEAAKACFTCFCPERFL